MNVSRDVVIDLIPVYLSGEASSDTQALVKAYAEKDAVVKAMLENSDLPQLAEGQTNQPIKEMETLKMTKTMLNLRSWAMGAAIFFTLAPLSFFQNHEYSWWMVRDAPQSAAVYAALAVIAWVAYFFLRIRTRVTGL